MKNLIPSIITALLLILAFIGYNLYYKIPHDAKEMAYWRDKAFKTDTVYKEKYTNTVSGKEYVPPAQVTNYYTTEDTNNSRLLYLLDSVLKVVDTLTKQDTKISKSYITQYPTAKKFIGGKFTKDTLSFDLLDIDGKLSTEFFRADYSHFNYFYANNSLRATEIKTSNTQITSKRTPFVRYDGIYANYEQGLIIPTKTAEVTLGLDLWKIRAQGFGRYNIYHPDQSQQGKFNAGVKVGFKF